MLGLIHRAVIHAGPQHFQEFFKVRAPEEQPHGHEQLDDLARHTWQLEEWRAIGETALTSIGIGSASNGEAPQYILRSALGLTSIYNLLPHDVVMCSPDVSTFQSKLQDMLKSSAALGRQDWPQLFSTRWNMQLHPLRQLRRHFEAGTHSDSSPPDSSLPLAKRARC